MQFMCFTPNLSGFDFQFWLSHSDHSKEKFRLARFFSAYSDTMLEIRPGNAVVGLAIIRTHAGTCSNQLINQTIVNRAPRYLFRKKNYGLAK